MRAPDYKQCRRCVMDTTDPDITFNGEGHCNHCSLHIEQLSKEIYQSEATDRLRSSILATVKKTGANKQYDCIIGISGGVDSSYTAFLAKQAGLNALLVHLDNGWNSEIAVSNIRKIATALNFDYESFVLDWEEFREIQLAFLRSSIVDIEIPTDLAIPAALHKIASKYSVKYIFSGGNYSSEGILPRQWGYHVMKDMRLYNHIVRKFGKVKRKKIPGFGFFTEAYYKMIRGIKTVYLLNYTNYNSDTAKDFLEKEFGCDFSIGKHHESRYTHFWQSYIMPLKYNFDYRKATLSNKICANQISRDEALGILEQSPFEELDVQKEKAYICKKLKISEEEFESFMKMPPLTYKNFPNQEKLLNFIFRVYKLMFPNKRL